MSGLTDKLTVSGTLTYNDYEIADTFFTTRMSITPIEDDAGIRAKYNRYRLSVEFYIASDTSIESTIQTIKQKLTPSGKALTIEAVGYGTINVNTEDVYDVANGPKVTKLEFIPYGYQGRKVLWEVEYAIPDCESGGVTEGAFSSFSTTISVAHDDAGLATRTIAIIAEVPVRLEGTQLSDLAFNYLEDIDVPNIPGFTRTKRWEQSPNGRTLTFTVTDTEEESQNPYWPGTIRMDLEHSLDSSLDEGLVTWHNEISGTVKVAKDTDPKVAYYAFWNFATDRMNKALDRGQQFQDFAFILDSVSVKEKINKLEHSFRVKYDVTTTLTNALALTGMFEPINLSTWDTHASFLLNTSLHNLGASRISMDESAILVVNLCSETTSAEVQTNQVQQFPVSSQTTVTQPPGCPPPINSWKSYKPEIQLVTDQGTFVFQATVSYDAANLPAPTGDSQQDGGGPGQEPNAWEVAGIDTRPRVQQNGPPRLYLVIKGTAKRICYHIPCPEVVSFAGNPVALVEEPWFMERRIGFTPDGLPIYEGAWYLKYLVTGYNPQVSADAQTVFAKKL